MKLVSRFENKIGEIALIFLLFLAVMVRLHHLNIPLERDEGEYAYMGQLILKGIPPYQNVYNMKFPGTYFMYALFMGIFGESIEGVHSGLIAVNVLSIVFMFIFVRKLLNHRAALIAATIFALLSGSASFCGFAGHATHFVVLFALVGILLLWKAVQEDTKLPLLGAGLALGFSVLMKQTGAFFLLFGGVFLLSYFISKKYSLRENVFRLAIYSIAGVFPFLLMLGYLIHNAVLDKFWFWTFRYALDYASQVPLNEAWILFKIMFTSLYKDFKLIWILGFIGVAITFFHPKLQATSKRFFLLLLLFFSAISVCPGFYFREHYFITFIPILSVFFFNYNRHLLAH